MANANKLNGFTPVAHLTSADYDGRGRVYAIPAANTNQIAIGDPVKLIAGADAAFGLPCIDIGASGATLVGVCIGLQKPPPQGTLRGGAGPWVDATQLNQILVRPAAAQTTNWYALIVDDPNVIFEVQDQTSTGAGVPIGTTTVTQNANFGRLAAGAVAPGFLSPSYIDNLGTGVPPNAATSNFRLLGLKQSIDNAPGAFQKWWCYINNHAYKAGIVGV
jgi:hypothetical protein